MKISELFDQSVFVTNSVKGVLREGAIAAGLTALMILVFLGSWRSTLVVMISIPLAILSSLIVLYFLGETLNTMTLGGLALAVGILVDDSTVTIENTHRLLTEEHMPLAERDAARRRRDRGADAGLDACHQLRVHLGGVSRRAGQIPVHAARARGGVRDAGVLRPVAHADADHDRPAAQGRASWHATTGRRAGLFARITAGVRPRLRAAAGRLYANCSRFCFVGGLIVPVVAGLDARPRRGPCRCLSAATFSRCIDGGQIQLHVRAPAGTRIESTERIFQAVEDKIREVIPDKERELIVDNIGLPARAYNLAFADGSTIGINDGVILVALKEGHAPTADYVASLRQVLPAAFPEDTFYFQAADIVTQILNFGLPAQIDVRTVGYRPNNLAVAKEAPAAPRRDSRHRRRAPAAGSRRAGVLRQDRSHPGRPAWPQRQHDRHQHQCQPEFVGAGVAQFLDRSDFGDSVLSRRADARISKSIR